MAIIGYARTSIRDQGARLQAQIRDLITAGCAERDIYTEQASSVRERLELDLLRRRILRLGDELVVTRLDRLARSARDTLAITEELGQRGATQDPRPGDDPRRCIHRIQIGSGRAHGGAVLVMPGATIRPIRPN